MSDMQSKDIINTRTGARLGRIVDINVNSDGTINYLVVSSTKMMRKTGDYKITFKDIAKFSTMIFIFAIFPFVGQKDHMSKREGIFFILAYLGYLTYLVIA